MDGARQRKTKTCVIGVFDTEADPDISFDSEGVCNYYYEYLNRVKDRVEENPSPHLLPKLAERISDRNNGPGHNCILGVSGGVDSAYLAFCAVRLGLKPLLVHLDNGWNSELAVKNIEQLASKLNLDLVTHVLDWHEFKNLQVAFLRASTPHGEIPTDHAIRSTLIKTSQKYGIRTILSGTNVITEGIMPPSWSYGHLDWKYIRGVHDQYSKGNQLRSYPHMSLGDYMRALIVHKIRFLSLLNYMKYDKDEAKVLLQEELDWKDYGGKHFESTYTKYYQGYLLPKKFNIDKRKAHLSALIYSGQISRTEALAELRNPPYPEYEAERDAEYVRKKLGLSEKEYARIMNATIKSHRDYPNNEELQSRFRMGLAFLRKNRLYDK